MNTLRQTAQANAKAYNQPTNSHCGPNHIAAVGLNQSQTQKGSNMNKVAILPTQNVISSSHSFNEDQVEILKNSICKGTSNEEFQVFLMACQKTQLDPFMKQIYAIKRWDNRLKRETMTIQTSIDGYRLIAERTERYAPGPKSTFEYDENGNLLSATSYVKKMTKDGTWHIVEAEAYFDEYCQTTVDKNTGERKAMGMWCNMQRNQLAKCAESLALRKAFPAEMSGIYTREEMKQSEFQDNKIEKISNNQALELQSLLNECGDKYKTWFLDCMQTQFNTKNIFDLPLHAFDKSKSAMMKRLEKTRNEIVLLQQNSLVEEPSISQVETT